MLDKLSFDVEEIVRENEEAIHVDTSGEPEESDENGSKRDRDEGDTDKAIDDEERCHSSSSSSEEEGRDIEGLKTSKKICLAI